MEINNRHFFFIIKGLFFTLCLNSIGGYVWAADSGGITQLDRQVVRQKEKIERIQSGISSHQHKIDTAKAKETTLLDELKKIDAQIQAENKKLITLQEEMARQQQATEARKKEITALDQEKNTLRHHMQERLNAYYRMGNIGLLNALFASTSLADSVSFKENFLLMLQYDRLVTNNFQKKMAELENARKAHVNEKERLARATEDLNLQQEVLNQTQQERQMLLERVKTERQLYQQALQELEEADGQMRATLAQLEKKEADAREERESQIIRDYPLKPFKKKKPASAMGFSGQKGKLPLPAPGVVLQKYAEDTDSGHGMNITTNGINIESPPGSDIIAVYDGKVAYTGTVRTYGNLIILDHGNHFFTLVSGVGEILKKVGETVKQGDKIGFTSLHTGILQESLHFEIRYNTETQDPVEWLEPSQISFKK